MVHLDESFQMPRDYDTGFILTSEYADKNRTSVPGLQKLPIDFLFQMRRLSSGRYWKQS